MPLTERPDQPPEEITMYGHSGKCRYCGGIVKMIRSFQTMQLQPDMCSCLLCGQPYYVDLKGEDLDAYDARQRREKDEMQGGAT